MDLRGDNYEAAENLALWSEEKKRSSLAGFYLASNEAEMLRKLREVFARKGFLGVFDASGRLNYYLEHSKNPYASCDKIVNFCEKMLREEKISYQAKLGAEQDLGQLTEDYLREQGFAPHLLGTRLLKSVLVNLVKEPCLITPLAKGIYLKVAQEFKLSPVHIDRSIRYASKKLGNKISNQELIYKLHRGLQEKLKGKIKLH